MSTARQTPSQTTLASASLVVGGSNSKPIDSKGGERILFHQRRESFNREDQKHSAYAYMMKGRETGADKNFTETSSSSSKA